MATKRQRMSSGAPTPRAPWLAPERIICSDVSTDAQRTTFSFSARTINRETQADELERDDNIDTIGIADEEYSVKTLAATATAGAAASLTSANPTEASGATSMSDSDIDMPIDVADDASDDDINDTVDDDADKDFDIDSVNSEDGDSDDDAMQTAAVATDTNDVQHERPAPDFICAVSTCARHFTRKEHLTRHTTRYHAPRTSGVAFPCEPCSLTFATRHEKELHGRNVRHARFPCTVTGCTKHYARRDHMQRHVATAHATATPTPTTGDSSSSSHEPPLQATRKPYRCDLCAIGFAYSHGLVRHQNRTHANANRPFQCPQCLVAFKKKAELQAHAFVHTGVLPFHCIACDARFAKRFQLTRHERKHAAQRVAAATARFCSACNAMLLNDDEQATHDRVVHHKQFEPPQHQQAPGDAAPTKSQSHSKKRKRTAHASTTANKRLESAASPASTAVDTVANRQQLLQCAVCGDTFQRKQNLRAHLRTHVAAPDARKLHACPMPECTNAYTRKSNLLAHYNAVHDAVRSQRFVCPIDGCDGKFGYKKVLQTHMATIHQEQPSTATAAALLVPRIQHDETKKKAPGKRPLSTTARVVGMRDDRAGDDASSTVAIVVVDSA